MASDFKVGRRNFFKQAAVVVGATTQLGHWPAAAETAPSGQTSQTSAAPRPDAPEIAEGISFPRIFTGKQLQMLSFPLGGVGAGSLSLGGRGQLRDWQIFNRSNVGNTPGYAFPSIWVQTGNAKPVARVLEGRILPPYEGERGVNGPSCPGLSRIETVEFSGAYPLANLRFKDPSLPVGIELDAFSPFIPHDPDDSGLPVAILRYRVNNPGKTSAKVAISFSIDNPVRSFGKPAATGKDKANPDARLNEYRTGNGLDGLFMSNPGVAPDDAMQGSFAVGVLPGQDAKTTYWRGWQRDNWWNPPMLYWDAFSRDGELLNEPEVRNSVGSLCQRREIPAGGSAEFVFLLAWHFPNRTPDGCGWTAPAGSGSTVIGNYYATRFKSAWAAAEYTAKNLESLEARTRAFVNAFSASTIPAVVKEAASANLSTLASPTCFRTADGEFHGFEGSYEHNGSCYGNCTHVWNYETATAFLFPSFARSLRKSAFDFGLDEKGGMAVRQMLPDLKERSSGRAADGQMGQIIHAYLDWKLCGDPAWLKSMWPRVKKAIEYAWIPGGWDADHDGVLEGGQPNTYDVSFFGPNPLCGIYYLGALRAAEEMALAVGEKSDAKIYRGLFENGSKWIDANLFQGEYYIQHIMVAPGAKQPGYQVGGGCLIDQLTGQYLANIAGLGPLVSPAHARTTLESIYRYNYKRSMVDYDCVERTYALGEEAAVVVCDYAKAERPHIPFPYFAEAWTGLEHSTAALMIYYGMIPQAVEYIENVRARHDGIKRNPWDECEEGHHYVRAMASWSSVVALSGFHYEGDRAHVVAIPPTPEQEKFRCFWATGTGWGTYSIERSPKSGVRFTLQVISGTLPCNSFALNAVGSKITAKVGAKQFAPRMEKSDAKMTVLFDKTIQLHQADLLEVEILA